MAKRQTKYISNVDNEIKYFVISNGFKIYPVNEIELLYIRVNKKLPIPFPKQIKWYIEVEQNSKVITFKKAILNSEIAEAIDKTFMHFYNELKNNKK